MNRKVFDVRFNRLGVHFEESVNLQEGEEGCKYDADEIDLENCIRLGYPNYLVPEAEFHDSAVADV